MWGQANLNQLECGYRDFWGAHHAPWPLDTATVSQPPAGMCVREAHLAQASQAV